MKRQRDIPRPSCKHTPGWIQTHTASIHCTGKKKEKRRYCHRPQFDLRIFDGKKNVTFLFFSGSRLLLNTTATTQKKSLHVCMCKPCVHDLLTHKCFTIVPLYWKKKEKEGEKKKTNFSSALLNIPSALSFDAVCVELILISWRRNLPAGTGSGMEGDVI